jgi:hypothetical protein
MKGTENTTILDKELMDLNAELVKAHTIIYLLSDRITKVISEFMEVGEKLF